MVGGHFIGMDPPGWADLLVLSTVGVVCRRGLVRLTNPILPDRSKIASATAVVGLTLPNLRKIYFFNNFYYKYLHRQHMV